MLPIHLGGTSIGQQAASQSGRANAQHANQSDNINHQSDAQHSDSSGRQQVAYELVNYVAPKPNSPHPGIAQYMLTERLADPAMGETFIIDIYA